MFLTTFHFVDGLTTLGSSTFCLTRAFRLCVHRSVCHPSDMLAIFRLERPLTSFDRINSIQLHRCSDHLPLSICRSTDHLRIVVVLVYLLFSTSQFVVQATWLQLLLIIINKVYIVHACIYLSIYIPYHVCWLGTLTYPQCVHPSTDPVPRQEHGPTGSDRISAIIITILDNFIRLCVFFSDML